MTNATITLLRATEEIDQDTGYRKDKADADIERLIVDARCVFAPSRSSRRAFAEGQREFVKLVPVVLLDHVQDLDVAVGDRATVTVDGFDPKDYRVGHAFLLPSALQPQWYIELEGVQSPSS